MILDSFKNADTYKGISANIAKALDALKGVDFTNVEDGKYEIDGDNIFYMVQRYQTKPFEQALFETHKKYIDIQMVVAGNEVIGYAPDDLLEVETPYNADNDVMFFKPAIGITSLEIAAGMFAIFFPTDVHAPCCAAIDSSEVTKIVVKVKA